MHCEKKGGECGYLGFLSEVSRSLPVERLAASDSDESTLGRMEELVQKALKTPQQVECTNDFCGIVAYAIVNTFELEATQNQANG